MQTKRDILYTLFQCLTTMLRFNEKLIKFSTSQTISILPLSYLTLLSKKRIRQVIIEGNFII